MAKKRGRRRRYSRNFVAIPFSQTVTLTTLADETVLSTPVIGAGLGEDLYIMSVEALWAIRGVTPTEGPISVGWAHSDLSVTEVNEALVAEVTDPDDIIAAERAKRPVRRSGIFPIILANEALNDGRLLKTKLKFTIGNDFNLNFWVKNLSGAALTTGAAVEVTGTIFGNWRR